MMEIKSERILSAPSRCKCQGCTSSGSVRLENSVSVFPYHKGRCSLPTLPFSDPIMRKRFDQVVLFFQGVFFSPSLSSPFSFRRLSRYPISVPPLAELHSYYPLTSLRFLATFSLVLPISPHFASASHIRLHFRPAPPVSPRWVAAASAPVFPSFCYFIAFTRPLCRSNDAPSLVALQLLSVCVVRRLALDRV